MKTSEMTVKTWQAPSAEASVKQVASGVKAWLGQKSETFSVVACEDVTRMDVVKAHGYLLAVAAVMMLVSWMEGGAA